MNQFTPCYGAGTKPLWAAKIDTYAMVANIALPLQVTWLGVTVSLHSTTETRKVKGLLFLIH